MLVGLEADGIAYPIMPLGGAHRAPLLAYHDDDGIFIRNINGVSLFVVAIIGRILAPCMSP
jgi:hypothetical protein